MTMEWNVERERLSQLFLNTLSASTENRRLAEKALSEDAAQKPNFGLLLLRLIAEPPGAIDDQIRQSAAVYFKNYLRSRWLPSPPDVPPITSDVKDQIKSLIVRSMLSSPPRIQSQLSEALTVIGSHDFPQAWPTLLPELVAGLRQATDYSAINGILETANSIFKKFRYQYKTNDLLLDLKYCLDNFAAPLLEIFLKNASLFDSKAAAAAPPLEMKPLLESQRLCCRLFYSLNFQDLPEFFEDHMTEWMTEFKKYLNTTAYPSLEQNEQVLAALDALRSAICDNIILYIEKNEEEFQAYLNDFALSIWNLLVNVSSSSSPAARSSPSHDRLIITAIKFLSTVSTSVHHSLFAGDGVIPMICQSIVIPNVRLRDEDEELFEMNHVEFMRRDMEGSDQDTRRRIACELLKGVAAHYKDQVTQAVSLHLQNLLSSFSANPTINWRDKECALYLVISLASKRAGGTLASTDLVDVQSFSASVVFPELQALDVNAFSMLKASALKFLTVFRNQISKPAVFPVFPDAIRFLGSESIVVHSYAANFIEKLLLVKDEGGRALYNSADINPLLGPLMGNLFNAMKFEESEENTCVMKCIMRVLGVADISRDLAGACIQELTSTLIKVCTNPKNPIFNHYLFESVALLVRRACQQDPSLVPAFEEKLFPILQKILAADGVLEFFPYAFQLLAQLVQFNNPPLSQNYMQIYDIILTPDLWKNSAYAPALARLLRAFLQKIPHELNRQGKLSQVLETFKDLILIRKIDDQGFYLLNTVIEYLRLDDLSPHMTFIWSVLFLRLQKNPTVKFVKSLVIFMSLFVVKHGTINLVNSMNVVQENIFTVILQQFWIPHLKLIAGAIEVKVAAVAAVKVLCETPSLLHPNVAPQWGKLLDSVVTLVSRPVEERLDEEPEVPELGGTMDNPASFIRLHNAGNREEDPVVGISDSKEFLVTSLAQLSTQFPGRFPLVIGEILESANQAALLQLCHTFNKNIV
uniref:Importin N-terminal domain-containing protein n=1 Tax=Kalanchoe fedtschenkoi TaxID=63787 RepID=A0A7N0VK74_KALFE